MTVARDQPIDASGLAEVVERACAERWAQIAQRCWPFAGEDASTQR